MRDLGIKLPPGLRAQARDLADLLHDQAGIRSSIDAGELSHEQLDLLKDAFRLRFGDDPGRFPNALHRTSNDIAFEGWLSHADRAGEHVLSGARTMAAPHRKGDLSADAWLESAGFMMGMRLELRQQLEIVHQIKIKSPQSYYEDLYDSAPKLRFTDYGLDFEVAMAGRLDAPEFVRLGSAGFYTYGNAFVIEDYFVDLDDETRDKFTRIIAVHEYGESIFQGHPAGAHHMASRLELAIAERMGALNEYMEFLDSKYALKFRDVALHRLEPLIKEALKEEGVEYDSVEDAPQAFPSDSSARTALSIAEGFEIPKHITERYGDIDKEDMEALEERLQDWAKYVTALEQTKSFYSKAVDSTYEALRDFIRDHRGASAVAIARELRLALFKALGALQYDLDNHLEGELLEDDLRESLFDGMMAELWDQITEMPGLLTSRYSASDDPIFKASLKEVEGLARADYAIWDSAGLTLRLANGWSDSKEITDAGRAEIYREQARIDGMRRAVWESFSPNLSASADSLDREIAAIESQQELGEALRKILNDLEHRISKRAEMLDLDEDNFYDDGELMFYLQSIIQELTTLVLKNHSDELDELDDSSRGALFSQIRREIESLRKPLIEKASAYAKDPSRLRGAGDDVVVDPETDFLQNHIYSRLAYLGGLFDEAQGDEKAAILDAAEKRVRYSDYLSPLAIFGLAEFSEGLKLALYDRLIDEEKLIRILPDPMYLPAFMRIYHLDFNQAIEMYRHAFLMHLNSEMHAGGRIPGTAYRALLARDSFMEKARSFISGRSADLFSLLERVRDAAGKGLACFTAEDISSLLDVGSWIEDALASAGEPLKKPQGWEYAMFEKLDGRLRRASPLKSGEDVYESVVDFLERGEFTVEGIDDLAGMRRLEVETLSFVLFDTARLLDEKTITESISMKYHAHVVSAYARDRISEYLGERWDVDPAEVRKRISIPSHEGFYRIWKAMKTPYTAKMLRLLARMSTYPYDGDEYTGKYLNEFLHGGAFKRLYDETAPSLADVVPELYTSALKLCADRESVLFKFLEAYFEDPSIHERGTLSAIKARALEGMAIHVPETLFEKGEAGGDIGAPLVEHYGAIVETYRSGSLKLTSKRAESELLDLNRRLRKISERMKGAGIKMKERRPFCRIWGDVVALMIEREIRRGKIRSEDGIREFIEDEPGFKKLAGKAVSNDVVKRSVELLKAEKPKKDNGGNGGGGNFGAGGPPAGFVGIVREVTSSGNADASPQATYYESPAFAGIQYMVSGNIAAAAGFPVAVRLPL